MGTIKDFRVKQGLVVEDGDVTLASDHTVKAGIFDTNVAAAGVTLTGTTLAADGTDTNIDINITPKGSGEVNITKVDINAGTIDGATIATSDVTVGSGKTLDVSGGTLTLANNQISGDKVEGGTIAATTITALTTAGITASANIDIGAYNFRAASITADGLTSGRVPFASTAGLLTDDSDFTFATDTLTVTKLGAYEQAGAVDFSDEAMTNVNIDSGAIDDTPIGANGASTGAFTTFSATGTSTLTTVDINAGTIDNTDIGTATPRSGAFTTLSATGAVTTGTAGSGVDVTFHSATSGDHMLWDASEEQLKIIGTSGQVALDIDTGNFTVGAYGLTDGGAATIASMAGNWTNAGRTVADAGILTTVDINGGTVDGATIGANVASTGKFTNLTTTSWAKVNGTARETNSMFQVNGPALSGSSNDTTMNYAEARIHTDIANDDVAGVTYNGMGNALVLDQAENIHVGQGTVYTQGRSGTGNSWGVGRQANRAGGSGETQANIFHIGYIAKDYDNVASSVDNPLNVQNYVMTLDTGGTAKFKGDIILDDGGSLKEAGGDESFTFDASGNVTRIGRSTHTNGYVLKLSGGNAVWAQSSSGADGMGSGFVLEDGDGTEVTIDEDKEVKFIDGDGLEINWTDTSTGSDGDPYDLTFSLDIDGMTDIGAGLASGDLFIVDDGAGGTNRKTTVDRIATLFAGTGLSASSGEMSVNAAQTAATSSMTSSTSRTITTPLLSIESSTSTKPVVQIKNTTNDQTGSELRFVKDKGAAGAASDVAGAITFYSDDAAQNNQAFGKIQTKTTAATSGSETGEIGLSVATSTSGALAEVLVVTGGATAATSTVDVKGHLIVRGTTTTVNSTTIDVADTNITLGNGVGNDAAIDGGGITLESSGDDKTFIWVDSTDSWTSNNHMNLTSISTPAYKIGGTSVLNANTLGSGVTASSLTTVGALNSGSITSGFGTINTGSSNITTSGTLAGGAITGTSLAVSGTITGDTSLTLDSTTLTTAELGVLDGLTVGTVAASKALTVDASRDVATIRNLTSDGQVQGATLSADAVAIIDTARGSGASISGATSLMNIAKATYRAAKVLYHIKKDDSVDTDAGEILITYNGTNAFLTHYAEISTGSAVVGTWDATVSGSNIEVRFTPTANGAHTYSLCTTQLIT